MHIRTIPDMLTRLTQMGEWVAVSASNYRHSPLNGYQAVNNPDKPLDNPSGMSIIKMGHI